MKIAIVTAMEQETLPIMNKLGASVQHTTVGGVSVHKYLWGSHFVYVAQGGVGELRAALTVQLVKDLYDVDVVLNFGFAGALSSDLAVGQMVLVDRVCHYQFDTSALDGCPAGQYWEKSDRYFHLNADYLAAVQKALPEQLTVKAVASGDLFVADAAKKHELHATFDCDVCEMELAGLAMACERNDLPLVSFKVISDMSDASAEVSFAEVLRMGLTHYEATLPSILDAVAGMQE